MLVDDQSEFEQRTLLHTSDRCIIEQKYTTTAFCCQFLVPKD